MERLEMMRQRLVEIALSIRREQIGAGLEPLEHNQESGRLQELYDRLRPAYAQELDREEQAGQQQAS